MNRAAELDPLSPANLGGPAWPLQFTGKYDKAKEQDRKALDLDPDLYVSQFMLGWADIEAGRYEDAVAELEKTSKMDSAPFVTGFLGYAYAMAGDRAKAEGTIAELNKMSSSRYVSPFCIAYVYLGLGDKERTLEEIEPGFPFSRCTTSVVRPCRVIDRCGF